MAQSFAACALLACCTLCIANAFVTPSSSSPIPSHGPPLLRTKLSQERLVFDQEKGQFTSFSAFSLSLLAGTAVGVISHSSRKPSTACMANDIAVTTTTTTTTTTNTATSTAGAVAPSTPTNTTGAPSKVDFAHVAREWRMKYKGPFSVEGPEQGGAEVANGLLQKFLPMIKAVDGVTNVERLVCGGCLDFKVRIKVQAAKFGDWEKAGFAPEKDFLEACKAIPELTEIETQNITSETM